MRCAKRGFLLVVSARWRIEHPALRLCRPGIDLARYATEVVRMFMHRERKGSTVKTRCSLPVVVTASVFLGIGCSELELPEEDVSASELERIPICPVAAVAGEASPELIACPSDCGDGICGPGEVNHCPEDCPPPVPPPYIRWSGWLDRDDPGGAGDWETLADFAPSQVGCALPAYINAQTTSGVPWESTGQVLTVSPDVGAVCRNADQSSGSCLDYRVKFGCVTPGWAALPRAWHEDHDRLEGNLEYFIPTSVSLPSARFREAMTFQSTGAFEIRRLAPDDAHYWAYGTWTRSGDVLTVNYYDARLGLQIQERFQVAELTSSVFRFRRI
jgi:hypothetical protein